MVETLAYLFDQTASRLAGKESNSFLAKRKLGKSDDDSSLRRASSRVAHGLTEMGVQKGDRVILFMPKSMEQVIVHIAIQKVGAISVILNPGFKKDEMEYFLEDTDAKIVFAGKKEEILIRSLAQKRGMIIVDTETPFSEGKLFAKSSPEMRTCRRRPS